MARGTLGVEEEYQLIDAETGALRPVNDAVLRVAESEMGESVHPELMRSQVEVSTPVCQSLDEVESQLRALRGRLNAAADGFGCRLGAAGTHPTARWETEQFTPRKRYLAMAEEYQQIADETLIFGCHVHVGVDDDERRIQAMNGIRPWLPTLLALSANSPYWEARDTGYGSYRTTVFRKWPTSGMPGHFASAEEYQQVVATLVAAGAVEDATHLYWDARPSARFPTLEVRVADVCLTVADAVTVTGLVAAMVDTALEAADAGRAPGDIRLELLEAAMWRAARHGLTDRLIDVTEPALLPAREVVDRLLATLRPALEGSGTWDRVAGGVRRLVAEGTGADRQRAVFHRTGSLDAVARYIADETAA